MNGVMGQVKRHESTLLGCVYSSAPGPDSRTSLTMRSTYRIFRSPIEGSLHEDQNMKARTIHDPEKRLKPERCPLFVLVLNSQGLRERQRPLPRNGSRAF